MESIPLDLVTATLVGQSGEIRDGTMVVSQAGRWRIDAITGERWWFRTQTAVALRPGTYSLDLCLGKTTVHCPGVEYDGENWYGTRPPIFTGGR